MRGLKKKISFCIMAAIIITVIFAFFKPANVYAQEAVSITNVSVNADLNSKKVDVAGNITGESNKNVTIESIDPNGDIDYIDQTLSSNDGKFDFTFTSNKASNENYTLKIGGEGITSPYTKTFTFKGSVNPTPVTPTNPVTPVNPVPTNSISGSSGSSSQGQTQGAVAKSKMPQTGSFIDTKVLIICGILVVAVGTLIILKKKSKKA